MNEKEIAAARETASNDEIRTATDVTNRAPEGAGPQNALSHTDSGNSGSSKTTNNGPGTAGDVPQAGPGAPGAYK